MPKSASVLAVFAAAVMLSVGSAGIASAAETERPPASETAHPSAAAPYVMFRNWVSGKCLEVLHYSTANNAPVGQYDCYGGANQLWQYDSSAGLLRNAHSGKCLEVINASTAENARIVQYTCDGAAHQLWTADWESAVLYNRYSGKCVAINGSTANFALAVQQVCNSNPGWGWWRW